MTKIILYCIDLLRIIPTQDSAKQKWWSFAGRLFASSLFLFMVLPNIGCTQLKSNSDNVANPVAPKPMEPLPTPIREDRPTLDEVTQPEDETPSTPPQTQPRTQPRTQPQLSSQLSFASTPTITNENKENYPINGTCSTGSTVTIHVDRFVFDPIACEDSQWNATLDLTQVPEKPVLVFHIYQYINSISYSLRENVEQDVSMDPRDETLPTAPTATVTEVRETEGEPDKEVDIEVSGVQPGWRVSIFTDDQCSLTSYVEGNVYEVPSGRTSLEVTISLSEPGKYKFYARSYNSMGASPCSTVALDEDGGKAEVTVAEVEEEEDGGGDSE